MPIRPVEDHRTRGYGVHRATKTIVDIAALVPSRNSHLLRMAHILATDRYSQMVLRDELLCPLLDVFVLRRKSNEIQTAEMVCHDNHIDAATANDRWGFRVRSDLLLREEGLFQKSYLSSNVNERKPCAKERQDQDHENKIKTN